MTEPNSNRAAQFELNIPDEAHNTTETVVTITGADPDEPVQVSASVVGNEDVTWTATATLVADDTGTVNLATADPETGTWEDADPMAWLWSMRPDDESRVPAFEERTYTVTLRAESGDRTTTATHTRIRWDETLISRDVNHDGLVGTLYEPAGDTPHPAVIDLHGSGGRRSDNNARRIASNGYATLALEYFGDHDALPDELANIPLSYVDEAAEWLLTDDGVTGDRVGLVGVSRGAELALILGARREWVGPVVSYSGSIPWDTPGGDPAWLDDGTPVPHLTAEKAPRFEDLDEKPVADVVPAVERTDGPILLLSGGDDHVWNSRRLSAVIARRLHEQDFPYRFTHQTYDDVGHFIGTPYIPLGGLGDVATQRATAHAGIDAWEHTRTYLADGFDITNR